MRIGVLGTGIVGRTLGGKLAERGQEVMMGSREPDNARAVEWAAGAGKNASHGTFSEAAAYGEVVLNCTAGVAAMQALGLAGTENLGSKILIDVSNPLDYSHGMPPSLTVCNTDSLGEQIQRAFPNTRVVKTLNTVNCGVMANPALVPGDHNIFVSGNDAAAKQQVTEWLSGWFGWKRDNIIDLGDITSARAVEMLLPAWVRLWGTVGTPNFNWHVVVAR